MARAPTPFDILLGVAFTVSPGCAGGPPPQSLPPGEVLARLRRELAEVAPVPEGPTAEPAPDESPASLKRSYVDRTFLPAPTPGWQRTVTAERLPDPVVVKKPVYGGDLVAPTMTLFWGLAMTGTGIGLLYVEDIEVPVVRQALIGVGAATTGVAIVLYVLGAIPMEYRVAKSGYSCGPGCLRW